MIIKVSTYGYPFSLACKLYHLLGPSGFVFNIFKCDPLQIVCQTLCILMNLLFFLIICIMTHWASQSELLLKQLKCINEDTRVCNPSGLLLEFINKPIYFNHRTTSFLISAPFHRKQLSFNNSEFLTCNIIFFLMYVLIGVSFMPSI